MNSIDRDDRYVPVSADGQRAQLPSERYEVYDPQFSLQNKTSDGEGGFQFWELIRVITRRKWMILGILILGVAFGIFQTIRQTPMYRATASIEIQRQDVEIIQNSQVAPNSIADLPYLETQYELLRSKSLAKRVVELLNLSSDPRYVNQNIASRSDRVERAAINLSKGIVVQPRGRSRVILVSYRSQNPVEAARIANSLVENFIETKLESKYERTEYARNFLQDRLAQNKIALEEAERSLVEYARQYGILDIVGAGGETSLDENALLALNNELATAESERIVAEQRFYSVRDSVNNNELLESPDLQRLRERRSDLAAEYQQNLEKFKPSYPDMVQLKARIDSIDSDISTERQKIVQAMEAEYKTAQAREVSLINRVEELKGDLQDSRDQRIQYTILQREVDTARSQYEALLERFKDVSIASGVGTSQVSIVDRAAVPAAPYSPNLNRSIVLAVILSLSLGIGIAFALNYIDDTIKTPEDVKTKLKLPAIGVIPKVKGKEDLILEELEDPRSSISEAFFSARTALEFATGTGAPKSLLLTSTQPGEGKTSTTVSLATSFAKIGRKVLIIDADMRKPSFVADAEHSIGLSGLLTRDALLSDHIISSKVDGLFLLPSGVIPPNPAELLSGPRLQEIIHQAEDLFDMVIVDSPPVMSFTDAPILGAVCQGALVVVRSGKIRRPIAERTIARLREAKTDVIGVVLMQFDAKKAGYSGGYYYYSYGDGAYAYGAGKSVTTQDSARRKIRLFSDATGSDSDTDELGL